MANFRIKGFVYFVSSFLLLSSKAHPQQSIRDSFIANRYLIERIGVITPSSATIPGIPLPAPELKGDFFLNEHFNLASLLIEGNQIVDTCFVRYDIVKDVFYLKVGKQTFHALSGTRVSGFSWIDSLSGTPATFVNTRLMPKVETTLGGGYFEVLSDGPVALVSKTNVATLMADFSIALNVGRSDHEIIKKTQKYVIRQGEVIPLPPIKKIPAVFGKEEVKVANFIKLNKLNLNLDNHLIAVFKYFNSQNANIE